MAMTKLIASRRFTAGDQKMFAELSHDWNPVHLDAEVARRSIFGGVVVHGMHLALWALDRYAASCAPSFGLVRLSATFQKPVFLDEEVDIAVAEDADGTRLSVQIGDAAIADLRLTRGGAPSRFEPARTAPASAAPKRRTLSDLGNLTGEVPFRGDPRSIPKQFPAACEWLGDGMAERLASLSDLVGMECPGLHSIFAGFEIHFDSVDSATPLRFSVEKTYPRISRVKIGLSGGGLHGTIGAFVRPPPVDQVSVPLAAAAVRRNEFQNQVALIVGGSRGLGEVTAKLVAAGGGTAAITYRTNKDEAERVVRQIGESGGVCRAFEADVGRLGNIEQISAALGRPITHLYYFPTPKIFNRRLTFFDVTLLKKFTDVYVTGFHALCERLTPPLVIFYPSTVAIDEDVPDLAEYIVAKTAGEAFCRLLGKARPGCRVIVERLPRLPTDQTATLQDIPGDEPLTVMLDVVRKMSAAWHHFESSKKSN